MFPEITRDEVFRIETPRLWLRWPGLADASTLAAVMAKECREAGSRLALANVQALEPIIMHWRQDMEAGRAFHLALVPKTGARLPVGMVHASTTQGLRLSPDSSLAQLGAEAVRSLEAMMALLGIEAPPQPRLDPRPMLHGGATHPGPPLASVCLGQ